MNLVVLDLMSFSGGERLLAKNRVKAELCSASTRVCSSIVLTAGQLLVGLLAAACFLVGDDGGLLLLLLAEEVRHHVGLVAGLLLVIRTHCLAEDVAFVGFEYFLVAEGQQLTISLDDLLSCCRNVLLRIDSIVVFPLMLRLIDGLGFIVD